MTGPEEQLDGQGDLFAVLDEIAHARNTDPVESHAAAASVNVRRSQVLVLDLLRQTGPVTDEKLVAAAADQRLAVSPSGVRSRRAELVRAGLVVDTGERVRLTSGRQAAVWKAADPSEVGA